MTCLQLSADLKMEAKGLEERIQLYDRLKEMEEKVIVKHTHTLPASLTCAIWTHVALNLQEGAKVGQFRG